MLGISISCSNCVDHAVNMTFVLTSVSGWHNKVCCVPTALSAISGLSIDDSLDALVQAAATRGVVAAHDPSASFNINDWLRVVRDLGGSWTEVEDYSSLPYTHRQTISQYLSSTRFTDLRLVFGENADVSKTHVFALSGSDLVDTYTAGQIATADPSRVPALYDVFRVKRVFRVSRP